MRRVTKLLLLFAVLGWFASRQCSGTREADPETAARASAEIDAALAVTAESTPREGLAAAILIDTSGSMDRPASSGGDKKIVVARRAALDLVEQFARYADAHRDEPVLLAVYDFSSRGNSDYREVVPMGVPDRARAAEAIAKMTADGGTPIGSAMIAGAKALQQTRLTRRHLLVVTDGENTDGASPQEVAAGIARIKDAERPSLYFVAFDIDANRFDAVRNAGGLVLGAADAQALNDTLDTLLRGKILVER